MGKRRASAFDGNSSAKKHGKVGAFIGFHVTYLVFFFMLLPSIMCIDAACTQYNPNSHMALWYFLLTLGGGLDSLTTTPYLDLVISVWLFFLLITWLALMD